MGALPWETGDASSSSPPKLFDQFVSLLRNNLQPGYYKIVYTEKGIDLVRTGDRPGPTDPKKPTETDADSKKPTETDTDAKKPTETDTDPKKPTETDTDSKKPTETDADSKKPTETDTDSKKPTETDTDSKKPTETDADSKKPTETDADSKKPTETDADSKKPTETDLEPSNPVDETGAGSPERQRMLAKIKALVPAPVQGMLNRLGAKLDQKDLSGNASMLDHLYKLADRGVSADLEKVGITTGEVLANAIEELSNPGIIHQSNRSTCVATTAQYYMAINHPAEYARLITDLVSNGEARMAGGNKLVLDPDSISPDLSTRNHIDRMFQTSLMDRSSLGDYDNRIDGRANGTTGMLQDDATRLLNDLTNGKDGTFMTYEGLSTSTLARMIDRTSRGIEVPVGMLWPANGHIFSHEMLVTKIEDGKVYLRNPYGSDDSGTMGPNRQLLNSSGDSVMTLDEFKRFFQRASLS